MARKKSEKVGVSTYLEFLAVMPCACALEQDRQMEILRQAPCPTMLFGKPVPQDLNGITFGQLDELGCTGEDEDPAVKSLQVIMGLTKEQVYQTNVFDVFGFTNMCVREYKRINQLFDAIKVHYTNDEVQAGINDMNFGTFGVLDWYAKRMGMTNQNDVYGIAWVRIFKCMQIDSQKNNYERRLHQVMSDRIKNAR